MRGHCIEQHRCAEKLSSFGKKILNMLRQNINSSLSSEMCNIIKTTHLLREFNLLKSFNRILVINKFGEFSELISKGGRLILKVLTC